MIRNLSHTTIYVHDHDEALEFYVGKLGFVVRSDTTMDNFRWLTISPKEQSELEIVLMEPRPGFMLDEEATTQLKALMEKGVLGGGVFHTDDCQASYEALKERGVEFMSPPAERPYGIEATFKDNSGNWFSLTQPRRSES
ncbi:MAG: VOC family protein [Myxococcota bacterium]